MGSREKKQGRDVSLSPMGSKERMDRNEPGKKSRHQRDESLSPIDPDQRDESLSPIRSPRDVRKRNKKSSSPVDRNQNRSEAKPLEERKDEGYESRPDYVSELET